jgi:hypothetical protein
MEIFHSLDLSQETILSLSRCRISLESIFLSDITTAMATTWRILYSAQAVGAGHLRFGFHAKLQQEKTGMDGLIFGTPSQQPATNSRFPLATGSILHIPYGNGFTGKIPMTYYRSRAQQCSITSRLLAFASLGQTAPTSCHTRNHSLQQQTAAYLFWSPAFLPNGLLNYLLDPLS